VWDKVHDAMTNLTFGVNEKKLKQSERTFLNGVRKSVYAESDQIRSYPNQQLAAHVVGFIGGDKETGLAGIERTLNAQLTGTPGWRRTETDGKHHEMVAYRDQEVEAQDGLNAVLTLDAGLQNIVETELADALPKHNPISISCTVVQPK